ncbi:hypothetical protein AWM70_06040 [Paenibacillus yonginensis]|uniref:Uncharacterized protein n=1 Tax=Paenibacillus yonginensis TaxID=1462996 RepID=A0A1B1MYF6_9BACL|nr:hypothetical protein [Paenibacillus yonginensis]ANS74196.1 hypothetical protein AWM70_06040 [Paenibacillus yonginensis]
MLAPLIVLVVLACLVSAFIPFGGILVTSVLFAVVVLQYQKINRIHEELQEIRKHLGLMKPEEKEEYEIEQQIKEVDQLDDMSREQRNQKIEEELANAGDPDKKD